MQKQDSSSEVARLRRQIRLEYEAAQRGLTGLAEGSAQHAFITRKMENMEMCYSMLKNLIGESQATQVLTETLEHINHEEKLTQNGS